jgi:hypothetical protein
VLSFRDEAFHRYFTRPEYLRMMRQRFGPDVEQHVEDMTRHRLRRKFALPIATAPQEV